MPERLYDVVGYLDDLLEVERFRDYGPNGLQVESAVDVRRIATGVSANLAFFERARDFDADLLVVHHGLIWGAGIPRVVGSAARRLEFLLGNQISLAGYHLPLDKHPTLGNNAGLADAIGLTGDRDSFGDVRGHALGLAGHFESPLPLPEALTRIGEGVLGGAKPHFVFPFGPERVRRVGLCTGAASDLLEEAARAGCDLFITGELAERAGEIARELQMTLVAAGHYATEVFGPQRLATALSEKYSDIEVQFLGVPSPL